MATMTQINGGDADMQDVDIKPQLSANGLASNDDADRASPGSNSPLSKLGIFKDFATEKKVKADGQPHKRRGPKPDSKPAMTRRQELNRQAQRTHRERKEMYIKALEQEVLKLKEHFGRTSRERDQFKEENDRLREILAAHGIQLPPDFATASTSAGITTQYGGGSFSSNDHPGASSQTSISPPPNALNQAANGKGLNHHSPLRNPSPQNLDYDQIGIDFVLTLERPCMDHLQLLCDHSNQSEADISGHAMMASCPTNQHLIERPGVQYPHQLPDMQASDLLKLLDLSNRLPLDGEITPVMAWAMVLRNENFKVLRRQEFEVIRDDLLAKVRCYGFGAVLEEFEVMDSITSALTGRSDVQVVTAA